MSFKIEKNVPVKAKGSGRKAKYPFAKMEVGDSFAFPSTLNMKIRQACYNYGQRSEKKFTVRTAGGESRCWRIK